ncbi:hypothetical protein KC362_g93 [Hortaea werneckii]|nr:hypothetical protein KC362_g93 [Hortaea werneckii]
MHFDSLSLYSIGEDALHLIDVPISIDGNGPEFASLDSSFAQTSTYHSPSAYESPPNGFTPTVSLPYYAHCSAHVDYFLDRRDSCMAYSNNKHRPSARPLSPVSASSSTSLVPPPWNDLDSATNMANLSSFSSWDGCYNSPGPNSLQREDYGQVIADDLVRMMAASERDDRESCDLIIPTTAPQEPWEETTFNDLAFTNEQRYLAAYWTWIHPQYPIVHKPTFDLDRTAPLLRASMLALGACMLQSRTDIENASAIHERCVKVLKCRSVEGTHTFRICDMQAIVLTEVYAIFKAQNLSAHFSPPFLQVYTLLENDHEALRHPSADEEYRSAFNFDGQRAEIDSQHGNGRAVDIACKQRLLSMCFILDQSNSAFFGRSQANCSAVAGHSLPFRQTASPRDASPRPQLDPEYDGRAASMPFEVFSSNPAEVPPAHALQKHAGPKSSIRCRRELLLLGVTASQLPSIKHHFTPETSCPFIEPIPELVFSTRNGLCSSLRLSYGHELMYPHWTKHSMLNMEKTILEILGQLRLDELFSRCTTDRVQVDSSSSRIV